MSRALDEMKFAVTLRALGHILGILGKDEGILRAVEKEYRNFIFFEAVNGTHFFDGIAVSQFRADIRQIDKKGRRACVAVSFAEHIVDIGKTAVRHNKIHIRPVLERSNRGSRAQRRLIKNLSKGYRQRVGIAQTLVGNPPVLILDEPTVGLDPKQIIEVRSLIRKLGEKHTVIFSSHILSEVQAVCDRIIVLNNGKLVADSTAESLSDRLTDGNSLIIKAVGSAKEIQSLLNGIKTVKRCVRLSENDGTAEFSVSLSYSEHARQDIFFAFAAKKIPIVEMKRREYSLEDIFMSLVDKKDKS